MALKINKKQQKAATDAGEGTVEVTPEGTEQTASSKTGAHVTKKTYLPPVTVPAAHATVGVMASRTVNIGDWNSVKFGVSLHFPCAPNVEAVESAYAYCVSWVDEKMERLVESGTGEENASAD